MPLHAMNTDALLTLAWIHRYDSDTRYYDSIVDELLERGYEPIA